MILVFCSWVYGVVVGKRAQSPNDPKLSDTERRRDACAAGSAGAGGVTERSVRCSAWLGDVELIEEVKRRNSRLQTPESCAENWRWSMTQMYPSYSAWLRVLEYDPRAVRFWERMSPSFHQVQSWLDQWIASGRPELSWPTEGEVSARRHELLRR